MKFHSEGFDVLGFTIKWYGVLIALGILLGVCLASRREKRLRLPPDTTLDIAMIGVPCAILGARLYYVVFSWEKYAAHPLSVFNLRQGGLAIYGGIIGGLLAGFVYSRAKRLPFSALLDLAAPSLALGQAIGRWGNFFNHEAFGSAIVRESLRFFPIGVYIPADGLWHYATFFYESVWCFLIVAMLLWGERKNRFHARGDVFLWYALLYALERTLVEGLRTDSLYWGSLRVSQLLSLMAVFAVAIDFACRAKHPLSAVAALFPAVALAVALWMGWNLLGVLCALTVAVGCAVCYRSGRGKRGVARAHAS